MLTRIILNSSHLHFFLFTSTSFLAVSYGVDYFKLSPLLCYIPCYFFYTTYLSFYFFFAFKLIIRRNLFSPTLLLFLLFLSFSFYFSPIFFSSYFPFLPFPPPLFPFFSSLYLVRCLLNRQPRIQEPDKLTWI